MEQDEKHELLEHPKQHNKDHRTHVVANHNATNVQQQQSVSSTTLNRDFVSQLNHKLEKISNGLFEYTVFFLSYFFAYFTPNTKPSLNAF